MSLICTDCNQKQHLMSKYLKLIKLLKTKCEKSSNILLKNQMCASETLFPTMQQSPKSSQSNIKAVYLASDLNQAKSRAQMYKTNAKYFGLLLIQSEIKKALLKQSFDTLKAAEKIPKSQKKDPQLMNYKSLSFQTDLSNLIQQTLSHSKEFEIRREIDSKNLKQLYFRIFDLQLKNSHNQKIIQKLEKQVQQAENRFLRQSQKKRQSLQTFCQEIREKNQYIVQLQHIIKRYQKTLGKSVEKFDVQNVLNQDEQDLKKNSLRLQSVNGKLNYDIEKAQGNIQRLNAQLLLLRTQNISFRAANKIIKQTNFGLSDQITKNGQIGQTYKNLCKKLHKKIQNIKLKQKQLYQNLKLAYKSCSLCSSGDIISQKNTDTSQQLPLSINSSLRQLDIEIKIQQIFSFLFNIQVEDYQMSNQQYFDKDQLSLLKLHKKSYLNSVDSQKLQTKLKTQKVPINGCLQQTDQICYRQSSLKNLQNSFFNVLQPKTQNDMPHQVPDALAGKIRMKNLQIQKYQLIQQISQLKNHHTYIRNIFLNFLRTLDLGNSKSSQSQTISQTIFQFFQYSQDQKLSIFREKKKKFWGIY